MKFLLASVEKSQASHHDLLRQELTAIRQEVKAIHPLSSANSGDSGIAHDDPDQRDAESLPYKHPRAPKTRRHFIPSQTASTSAQVETPNPEAATDRRDIQEHQKFMVRFHTSSSISSL
jgi:hypothetical protein